MKINIPFTNVRVNLKPSHLFVSLLAVFAGAARAEPCSAPNELSVQNNAIVPSHLLSKTVQLSDASSVILTLENCRLMMDAFSALRNPTGCYQEDIDASHRLNFLNSKYESELNDKAKACHQRETNSRLVASACIELASQPAQPKGNRI